MDKKTISNHSWICRTLNGTIALEEKSMPLKERYFLKSVAKPIRVSDLYIILKEKYSDDYRSTSDFIEMVNIMNRKMWISRVEKPQVIENEKKTSSFSEEDTQYSRDSLSIPEEIMNLSRKAQNSLSEDVNPYPMHFESDGNKDSSNNLDALRDEIDDYDDGVAFVPDEKTKELIMKLGLNNISEEDILNDDEALALPEENPFYQEANFPMSKAAESMLKQLDAFQDIEYVPSEDDVISSGKTEAVDMSLELPQVPVLISTQQAEESQSAVSNESAIAKDREEKRQERMSKRASQPVKKAPVKSPGLFGSIKDGFKKIIGK